MWRCEDDHTLHFALPLVDVLDTSKALWTMATAEARGRMAIFGNGPSVSQSSLQAVFQHLADVAL